MVQNTTLVLVDTPGFDDSSLSDYEVLKAIAAWLEKTFEKGYRLNGLLYMHRINNARMEGSACRAFQVFKGVCGEDNYQNVILATTFWNKMDHCQSIAIEREKQLLESDGFWRQVKEKGAATMRLTRDYSQIVPALLRMAERPKVTLDIQRELKSGVPLDMTMAGLLIKDERQELEQSYEQRLAEVKSEFDQKIQRRIEERARATAASQRQMREKDEEMAAMQKSAELMQKKLAILEERQRRKEAELQARLKQAEEAEAEQERQHAAEQKRLRDEAQKRESTLRLSLSTAFQQKIEQQLEIFRMVRAAGMSQMRVPEIGADGSARRSGLNTWCDYCLKPFGMDQMFCKWSSTWRTRMVILTGWCLACSTCKSQRPGDGALYSLCEQCYRKGRRCFDKKHPLRWDDFYHNQRGKPCCQRLANPCEVQCDVATCKNLIVGIYFRESPTCSPSSLSN